MSDPWSVVAALGSAIRYGGSSLADVPVLVIKVVDGDLWKKFRSPAGIEEHRSFEEFVRKPHPGGLGSTIKMLKNLCRSNKVALDAIDTATQRSVGAPVGNANAAKDKMIDDKIIDDDVHNSSTRESPTGNSESAGLRRLRKDRADLHAQVLNGELSTHAACVKAGFRPRTFTVRADDPEKIAATLRQQLPEDILKQVINHLEGW